MNVNNFQIKIGYCQTRYNDKCPMISITDGEDNFDYSCIFNMYEGGRMGHGIQVDEKFFGKEDILMKMCDKIAQAVYDAKKELENE